jgi:ABC-type glycerol-3-phosphate transport system permease component
MNQKRAVQDIFLQILTIVIVLIMLFPVIWLVSTSLKPESQMFTHPLDVLPRTITLDNFVRIWNITGFQSAFRNSLVVAATTSIAATSVAFLAAFSLSRFKYRLRAVLSLAILGMQTLPGIVVVVPLILILRQIGLTDSLIGLIIAYQLVTVPVATWLLKSYMDDIPIEIDEAALIDGASYFQLLTRILVPLLVPAAAAVGAFSFILAWGEYVFAVSLISSMGNRTLPLALQSAFGQYDIDWGLLNAGGVIISLPPAILFIFFQRYLVSGLTIGGVKG